MTDAQETIFFISILLNCFFIAEKIITWLIKNDWY